MARADRRITRLICELLGNGRQAPGKAAGKVDAVRFSLPFQAIGAIRLKRHILLQERALLRLASGKRQPHFLLFRQLIDAHARTS